MLARALSRLSVAANAQSRTVATVASRTVVPTFVDSKEENKKSNVVVGRRMMSSYTSAVASNTPVEGYHVPATADRHAAKTGGDPSRRAFGYFVVGGLGALGAVAIKNFVVEAVSTMLPSADVLALASIEVDLGAIPEGQTVTISWRGKPLFVRHRTERDIQLATGVDLGELKHRETDEERVQRPEWLVVLGVCTHLGCVPIDGAGDYNGWFCPCHGSHYDTSGRIRKGPAPLNLEIPPYKFVDDSTLLVG
eukprot:TRINITY_DN18729_c0_g1_i1.p1 TRINITY_DN18729_c0_g1~~TRINITY_DN18729_c0_g1_i1.p1  ORF type:complete len:251 (+),score=47.49 TRINITY_DN18729_c0_g1_i1:55-807(+)